MLITLLSDFGDGYPASMKGVILGINPAVTIVDISHAATRHDIGRGAFMLMAAAKYFPPETVHIAVIDPGVGTERRALAIRGGSQEYGIHYFIGPNNGLLIPAARSMGDFEVYEITNTRLLGKKISPTFHGRDIFAPVGAHVSKGVNISEVGRQIRDYIDLDFGGGKDQDGLLKGKILYIDSFGNMVTNITGELLQGFRPGDRFDIEGKKIAFQQSYGFCERGEPLVLIGSHDFLEIAVNQGNAARFFRKEQGDEITLRKIT